MRHFRYSDRVMETWMLTTPETVDREQVTTPVTNLFGVSTEFG